MSRTTIIRFALSLFLVSLIISSLLPLTRTRSDSNGQATDRTPPVEPAAAAMPSLKGEEAIEHLKEQGTYGSLKEAMAAVKYEARWQPAPQLAGVGAAYEMANRANNLLAYVTAEGIEVTALTEAKKPWRLGLKLTNYGYGANLSAVQSGEVRATGNRVEIVRDSGLVEWFVNTNRGIEQGFTLSSRPTTDDRLPATDPLRLRMAVTGDLQMRVNGDGSSATFTREGDSVEVNYDKLFVMDAKGRTVEARMLAEGRELIIEVQDAEAEYPLTIDPHITQQAKIIANDGAAGDGFGSSVAISGDTVVVGSPFDNVGTNTDQGSAYVFTRSSSTLTWSEQAKLTAFDSDPNDHFGRSVAIDGDHIVVGSYHFDDGPSPGGAAFYFTRSGTTWTRQARLTAFDGTGLDDFGYSVAIRDSTIVVGAYAKDEGANFNQGAVYVFSGSSFQAKLLASDGAASDFFGYSVAISGNTIVVGAPFDDVGANADQGSAYVFIYTGSNWIQQQKLTAADGAAGDQFGYSVAISGDTVVVGAPFDDVGFSVNQGSAYVFIRSGTTWSQQRHLTAADGAANFQFGYSVTISGDTVVVGAFLDDLGANNDQGSAYVFTRSGTTWTQQPKLSAADGAANDQFGNSVAINGDTIVVGAWGDDVGANANQGCAYTFCLWSQQGQLFPSVGSEGDDFGYAVAISSNIAVVGAFLDDVGANADQGSAYVFTRNGTTWQGPNQLIANDGAAGDHFGESVAISGLTIVVGASSDDVGANVNQGSAYVFIPNGGGGWIQQQKLTAADGLADDRLGISVAISGDTIVAGAHHDDSGMNTNQGSAYVFIRSGVIWMQQAKLTAADGATDDFFGFSVAISGYTVVVGAYADDVDANNIQGSAYVFVGSGAMWTQQQQLTAADGAAGDQFGYSVAISGDSIVVGAFADQVGADAAQGSAYVFVRSGLSWAQQQRLLASGGAASDFFGYSVAISGNTVVVGALTDDVGANTDQGSAYIFVRNGALWLQEQQLIASDGAASDVFGASVAISGNTIVVGAYLDTVGGIAGVGSAYTYIIRCNTVPSAAPSHVVRQKGSPATTVTIANVFDSEDPIGSLLVIISSVPAGISITGIGNSNGEITAQISAAACNAALGNYPVVLLIVDSEGAVTTVTSLITVTSNTLPTLGAYNDTSVLATSSTTIAPMIPPWDNGSIVEFSATSPTFAGILGAEPEFGVITISNARPAGTHIVTVTAMDNCGATISSGFILTVTCQTITVNPSTIPAGTAGSSYSQTFTQTGGMVPVTFSLSGALPTGLLFNAGTATLSGTPTQVGSFPIAVTATDRNNCSGSRSYTLTINAPTLVWNGGTSSDWHTAANWTPNAVPTTYHDVLIPTSGVINQPVIGSASSSINAMTLQAGRVLTIDSSRLLATAGNITCGGLITGAGSLLFDGATFIQNGSVSVASVEFTAGVHALTGGGSFASGIITVLGGASVALTSNHSVSVVVINSGGSLDITNRTLTLTGAGTAIFNSGSVNATGSTIIYQGMVSQVVTANIGYNNLTINNPAGVSLAGDTTVNGLLDLQTDLTAGSFTLTMPASGSSSGEGDVIGKVKRTGFVTAGAALSFGNPLNRIRIDTGTAPTDITVELVNLPPFGYSNTVRRSYTITANGGSGIEATLRLRYKDADASGLDETTFELWRQAGGSWQSPASAATRDTTQNWVEESGITEFSVWTIAGGAGPICGVLSPISQYFEAGGSEGSVIVTALANCSWAASSNVSWIEVMSSPSGTGTEVVSYVVRDNFTAMPRMGTITIAGQTFTVVQDSVSATECSFTIAPKFATYIAGGGAGNVDITTEGQCAWEAISDSSWITITSVSCGIGNGTITYSVGANPGPAGRNGTITIGGKVFAVKQKGQ